MLLMTVSTVVMIVLLSKEVVHIPHESRSSFAARYPLDLVEYPYTPPGCALGHHYKAFQLFF
jgi:hypothetical protein